MNRLLHVLDGLCVLVGLAVLFVLLVNNSPAVAASLLDGIPVHQGHPVGIILGLGLTSAPLSRRVIYHSLMRPGELRELTEVGHALHRIALFQRVQAGNVYLTHMDEQGVRNVFSSEKGLWDWLGPAYRDETLRRQMDPKLQSRLDRLAAQYGNG